MIPLFRPSEVRALDERAIAAGTPSLALMERAAGHLARNVVQLAGRGYGLRVAVLCGKGNNGGDGVALARRLTAFGAQATVCLTGWAEGLSPDGVVNLERWRAMGGRETSSVADALDGADVAVDCLLGTGARGAPRDPYAAAVTAINGFDGPVVACDVPTGVDASTGQVAGEAVRADCTVTLGAHKRGLWLWPARGYTGALVLGDLGFDLASEDGAAEVLDGNDVLPYAGDVPADAEKRTAGVVAVWAGSEGMSGAAVMAGHAAMAGGAGLVTLLVPDAIRAEVAGQLPEALTVGLPADSDGAFQVIATQADSAAAIAIGPGLGIDEATQALVRRVVAQVETPMVVDADGLNAFRADGASFARAAAPMLVLTPHARELQRLVIDGTLTLDHGDLSAGDLGDRIWPDRSELLPLLAAQYDATVVAKGPGSVVAAPDGRAWVNPTGSGALATAGTGDVLTGLTAALVAGTQTPQAVAAAVWLHGRAGEMAAAGIHARSVTAMDVAGAIPAALTAAATGAPPCNWRR